MSLSTNTPHHNPLLRSLNSTTAKPKTQKKKNNHNSLQLPLRIPKQPRSPIPKLTLNHNNPRKRTSNSTSTDVLSLVNSLSQTLPIPLQVYVSLVKECTVSRDATTAAELHSQLVNREFTSKLPSPVINRVLLMYVSCGDLAAARQVFDEMTDRKDFTTWAVMILGYLESGFYCEGIGLFVELVSRVGGVSGFPKWVTARVLKTCVEVSDFWFGKQVHAMLLKLGSSGDACLAGSLINFYGKFGYLEDADFVFNGISKRNTFAWMAKIGNNSEEGRFVEVIKAFNEMGREGVRRNSFTFSLTLRACTRMDDIGDASGDGFICGQQVHANAVKLGLDLDEFVGCGLVDMYGKRSLVGDAQRAFETAANKSNAACWNAMVMGYLQNGLPVEALKLLYRMNDYKLDVCQSLMDQVRIACGSVSSPSKAEGIGLMHHLADAGFG